MTVMQNSLYMFLDAKIQFCRSKVIFILCENIQVTCGFFVISCSLFRNPQATQLILTICNENNIIIDKLLGLIGQTVWVVAAVVVEGEELLQR